MGSNMQRFGNTLTDQMKKTATAAIPLTINLGTIGSNLSLSVDGLRKPIDKGEYMINLMLAGGYYRSGSDTQTQLPGLKSGDRVLVVWCGNEPVVVATVVSS